KNTLLSVTGNTGTAYWESSPDGVTAWASISGGIGDSYIAQPSKSIYYRAKINNGLCATVVYTNSVYVKVISGAVSDSALSSKTICSGTSTGLTLRGNTGFVQ